MDRFQQCVNPQACNSPRVLSNIEQPRLHTWHIRTLCPCDRHSTWVSVITSVRQLTTTGQTYSKKTNKQTTHVNARISDWWQKEKKEKRKYSPSIFSDFMMVNVGFISTAAVMIIRSLWLINAASLSLFLTPPNYIYEKKTPHEIRVEFLSSSDDLVDSSALLLGRW